MKGRKGKKASKKAQNNASNAQHAQNPPPGGYDRRDDGSLDPEDEYDDYGDYDDGLPQGQSCCHHGCQHTHPPPKVPPLPPGDSRLGMPPASNGA